MRTPKAERAISRAEQVVLDRLRKSMPNEVSTDSLYTALYGHLPECDQPESRIIPVVVCNLRKKIKAMGLEIIPIRHVGYKMVEASNGVQQ